LVPPENHSVYRVSILDEIPWIEHGYGTKSAQPGFSALVTIRQIHSDRVIEAQQPGCAGEGDALITDQPGLALSIRTADCLPILLVDTKQRAIAAVHAGWRGLVSEIAPKTVVAMTERFGTRVEDLRVAIGPGIGHCCFEVGPEVAIRFQKFFPERTDLDRKTTVDLSLAVIRQLGQIGILEGQIVSAEFCTFCRQDLFHSYRRDRESAGRMVSAIGLCGETR
jgi:polyphenol oxidase